MIMNITHNRIPPQDDRKLSCGSILLQPLIWARRIHARRQLMRVLGHPDYLLKDVGISRDAMFRESMKWFWQK